MKVKINHGWYDGPVVGTLIETGDGWVPYGDHPDGNALCEAMEAIDPDWNVETWPEGIYEFTPGDPGIIVKSE